MAGQAPPDGVFQGYGVFDIAFPSNVSKIAHAIVALRCSIQFSSEHLIAENMIPQVHPYLTSRENHSFHKPWIGSGPRDRHPSSILPHPCVSLVTLCRRGYNAHAGPS